MPAMPAPRITTDLPLPTLAGQSSGRGELGRGGGGGEGAGGWVGFDAADDEPQAATEVLIPRASIARSIAEPPAALPIEVRNSLRAIPRLLPDILIEYYPGIRIDTNRTE